MTKKINPSIEREWCAYCSEPMHRRYRYNSVRVPRPGWEDDQVKMDAGFTTEQEKTTRYTRGYSGHNIFCSLRCGYWFAIGKLTGGAVLRPLPYRGPAMTPIA